MIEVDTLILGAGPVGAITAWSRARRERVAISARKAAGPVGPVLELVPSATIELLLSTWNVRTAIAPAEERLVAWDGAEPRAIPGGAFVIERGALDAAVFAWLLAATSIQVVPPIENMLRGTPGMPSVAESVRAWRIIDARGRAALTPACRRTLTEPWLARALWGRRPRGTRSGIRVATLPSGYAVRHVAADYLVLTLVGPASASNAVPGLLQEVREHATFLLESMADPLQLERGVVRRASVEVFTGSDGVLRVGDAAFARDALSSQGLAAGLSEGLYAAAIDDECDAVALQKRRWSELRRHLDTVQRATRATRFCDRPAWAQLAADLNHLGCTLFPEASAAEVHADGAQADCALVDGKLVTIPGTATTS